MIGAPFHIPQMTPMKVLLIDPDQSEAAVTRTHLSDAAASRFQFVWTDSIERVLAEPAPEVDAIIVDVDVRERHNLLNLSLLAQTHAPNIAVVVLSAVAARDSGVNAIAAGAEDFWLKGDMEPEQLAGVVIRAVARKQLEITMRAQSDLLNRIMQSLPEGIASADCKGNLTFFNKAATMLAGIGVTDSTPDSWQQTYGMYRPDQQTPYPAEETPLFKAIQGIPSDDAHLFVRHARLPQGRMLNLSARPLTDEEGQQIGGVVTFREVQGGDEN
jgi:DNA-binding NarL/FixJ family response regulator